jgi:transcriptional regulator with XRE-family HTH domain
MKKRPYLQAARFAKGYNQTEFAKLIGISQQYLSQVETSYVVCPDDLIKKIAGKLEIDYLELRKHMLGI